jgi:protein deglycase
MRASSNLLKKMAAAGKYTAAICAAPMVLAEAGCSTASRRPATPAFSMDVPGVTVSAAAVVQDGKVLTSRGPGTAMDFALALVETLTGAENRRRSKLGWSDHSLPRAIVLSLRTPS